MNIVVPGRDKAHGLVVSLSDMKCLFNNVVLYKSGQWVVVSCIFPVHWIIIVYKKNILRFIKRKLYNIVKDRQKLNNTYVLFQFFFQLTELKVLAPLPPVCICKPMEDLSNLNLKFKEFCMNIDREHLLVKPSNDRQKIKFVNEQNTRLF